MIVKFINSLLLFTFVICSGFTFDVVSHTHTQNDSYESVPDTSYLRLETRIAAGENDVEESGTNGNIYFNSTDLELCHDRTSTGNQVVGLRFTGIYLPPGVEITRAYIEFTVDESVNTPGLLTISGEDAVNSEAFQAQAYDVSSRARTYASVAWLPTDWLADGSVVIQRSEDISEIVQEIVNKDDFWGIGIAMTFIIEGDGKRIAKSHELDPNAAPMLYVEFEF